MGLLSCAWCVVLLAPHVLGVSREFDGIGAVSASSSRLLYDYPPQSRSRILDWLFLPQYGAALQHLKVEIGGDGDSTCMSEPSHQHSSGDLSYHRGWEYWLLSEAKTRNPSIQTSGLWWTAPGYLGPFYTEAQIPYLVNWLRGARDVWNVTIDYLAVGHNEQPYNTTWIKQMRQALNAEGFTKVKTLAADEYPGARFNNNRTLQGNWQIALDMLHDPEVMKSVDVVTTHGTGPLPHPGTYTPQFARDLPTNKRLWASEGHFNLPLPSLINQNYVLTAFTSTLMWPLVASALGCYPDMGFMQATMPWADDGNNDSFVVRHRVWEAAHTTHFTEVGWLYEDQGCGMVKNVSYVTLVSPTHRDVTVVIESLLYVHSQPLTLPINLTGLTHPQMSFMVWVTNHTVTFQHLTETIPVASNGSVVVIVPPNTQITLTTVEHKEPRGLKSRSMNNVNQQPPNSVGHFIPSIPFPPNWVEDFDHYKNDSLAKFFVDQYGSFTVIHHTPPRSGGYLKQIVPQPASPWSRDFNHRSTETYIGVFCVSWSNVRVSLHTVIESTSKTEGDDSTFIGLSLLNCFSSGVSVMMYKNGTVTAYSRQGGLNWKGSLETAWNLGVWRRVVYEVTGFPDTTVSLLVDNKRILQTVLHHTGKTPLAGDLRLMTGYHYVGFDNLVINGNSTA